MNAYLKELSQHPESEEFEKKSELVPTKTGEMLELIKTIVSMANTRGGKILIGTEGKAIPRAQIQHFDSARLDDKANGYIEPHLGNIRTSVIDGEFVLIEVEKGQNPPYMFKRDGSYHDEQNQQRSVFRRGEILVRHSSKSERAERSDLDRMFSEREQHLFEKVKMIFEAPPDASIRIGSDSAIAVRIDPNAPGAQPVYDLLTADPFRDIQQELKGAVKAWKTSRQLLNEAQIFRSYREREQITDAEFLELLLRSCWERWLPGYFWATKLEAVVLLKTLEDVIKADLYPSCREALKVASLLPRKLAKASVQLGYASKSRTVTGQCRRLESILRSRSRKHITLAGLFHPGNTIRYKVGEGRKVVEIGAINGTIFNELLETMVQGMKENRSAFKAAKLMTYGPSLGDTELPSAEVADAVPLTPPSSEHSPIISSDSPAKTT